MYAFCSLLRRNPGVHAFSLVWKNSIIVFHAVRVHTRMLFAFDLLLNFLKSQLATPDVTRLGLPRGVKRNLALSSNF